MAKVTVAGGLELIAVAGSYVVDVDVEGVRPTLLRQGEKMRLGIQVDGSTTLSYDVQDLTVRILDAVDGQAPPPPPSDD